MSNNSEHVHDWGATRLLNPDKQIDFLLTEGIDTTNSKLESRDFYKNKNKVQEAFKKDNGEFDEELYNKWYDQIATEYEYLSAIDTENFILDQYEKSESDFTTKHGKRKNHEIAAEIIANPLDQSMGARAWNIWSDPEISRREAAQNNKYYDPETRTWSDKTVNELGALGLITGESLVYATYDEDVHDENGNLIHAKGEWKLDEFGNYYTEKAGNKEHINKQFVKISEVLTDDESAWNKIDIFDSDNLETNIPKTVFRAAATVGAMLIPYYNIGKTISLVTAAVNFARTMPQISKTITSFFSEDVKFNKLNTWDNYMQKFRKSKSDYANDNFFSFENIIDMAVDSFSQLSQQRAIAQLPRSLGAYKGAETASNKALLSTIMANPERTKLLQDDPELLQSLIKANPIYRNAENAIKNAEKISTLVSRAYMVATSTEDSYNLARSYGFDTQTSSLISLATYAGIGALFSTDYGRAMLYNTPDYELRRDLRAMVKSYLENNKTKILGQAAVSTTNESKKAFYKNLGTNISNFIKKHISDVKSGHFSIGAGMMAEGLEETAEEVVQDAAIQIGKGWNQLKELFTNKEYTDQYNYFESDPLKRYGTAFFGGALGGGIFKLADRLHFDKNAFTNWKKMLGDNSQLSKEFVTLISQGKADLIIREIERLEASPMMSTTISAFNKEIVTNNVNESQNGVLFGTFKKAIRDLDTFLSNSNLEIDYETFGNIELIRGLRGAWINHENLQDSLFNDYLNIVRQIANEHGELTALRASKTSDMEESKKAEVDAQISEKEKTIKDLTEKVRKLVRGEDDSYLGRLMLQANPSISKSLIPNSKDALAYRNYGVKYDDLSALGKQHIDSIFTTVENSGQIERDWYDLWEMWKGYATNDEIKSAFKTFSEKVKQINGNIWGRSISDIGFVVSPYWTKENWSNAEKMAALDQIIELTIFDEDPTEDDYIKRQLKQHFADILKFNIRYTEKDEVYRISDDDFNNQDHYILNEPMTDLLMASIQRIKVEIENFHEKLKTDPNASIDVRDVGILARNFDDVELLTDLETLLSTPRKRLDGNIFSSENEFAALINMFGSEDFSTVLSNEIKKIQADKTGYRMTEPVRESLKKLSEILQLIKSLAAGSYDNYHSTSFGIPFGANAFMNSVFKEKKIPIELLMVDENTILWLNHHIDEIVKQIEDLNIQDHINSQESFKADRMTCLRLSASKLNALSHLKEHSDIFDDIESLQDLELSSFVNPDVEDLTDEQIQAGSLENRQRLILFERAFSNWWKSITLDSKKSFISQLRTYIKNNGETIHGDTSPLSSETKNEIFKLVDLYHYLASISFGNIDLVENLYKEYVTLDSDRIPYDSQEEVIKYAWRYLFRTNRTDEELWFNDYRFSDDTTSITKGLKLICYAGTGKTSTIIPAINWALSKVFPEKNSIFAANTNNQIKNLKRSLANSGTYFLTNELISKLDTDEMSLYENSVILIDECTHLTIADIKKLSEVSKKYNIDVIYVGDTYQSGSELKKDSKGQIIVDSLSIDSAMMLSTPTLADSRRAKTDLTRLNQIIIDKLATPGKRTLEPGWKVEFQYYEGDIFAGTKFEKEDSLSIEYIENFFSKYNLDPSTPILIFTTNAKIFDNKPFLEKFPNITITDSFKEIQGAEWDYVFTDVVVDNRKDEYDEYLNIRTLFTRANYGTISFNNIKFTSVRHEFTSTISKFPPVEISISQEIIDEFKKFKMDILNALSLENTSIEKIDQKTLPEVEVISTPFVPVTVAQSTPGFILPQNQYQDQRKVQQLVNILYQILTTQDKAKIDKLKKLLPPEYQDGEFLIRFSLESNYRVGNLFRDEKYLNSVYPWIVWKPANTELDDVVISLFHNPQTAEEFGLEETAAAKLIFSLLTVNGNQIAGTQLTEKQKEYWLTGNNGKPIRKYFRIPKNITIGRSSNNLAIQNQETNSTPLTIQINHGKMEYKFGTTPMFFKMTRPVYFDETIEGSTSTPYFKEIYEALEQQENLYEQIATILLNGRKDGPISDTFAQIQHITHLLKNTRGEHKNTSYTAKGTPHLLGNFVTFVELDDGQPVNSLNDSSASYYSWVLKTNEHLNEILSLLREIQKSNDQTSKNKLQDALLAMIPTDVSIIAFNPEFLEHKNEIEDCITNIAAFDVRNKGYKIRLAKNMINVLDALFKVYEMNPPKSSKKSNDAFLMRADYDYVRKYIDDERNGLIARFRTAFQEYYGTNLSEISDDEVFNTLIQYLNDRSDAPKITRPEKISEKDLSIITKVFGDILKNIFADTNAKFSKIIRKIQNDARSSKSHTHAAKVLHAKLLKDNGANIHVIGIAPLSEGGEVTIKNKIIQRAQIHMYIPTDLKISDFEEIDTFGKISDEIVDDTDQDDSKGSGKKDSEEKGGDKPAKDISYYLSRIREISDPADNGFRDNIDKFDRWINENQDEDGSIIKETILKYIEDDLDNDTWSKFYDKYESDIVDRGLGDVLTYIEDNREKILCK